MIENKWNDYSVHVCKALGFAGVFRVNIFYYILCISVDFFLKN